MKTMTPTPVTYIKPKHPDYVQLTLVQADAIKTAIKAKYALIRDFCEENGIAYTGFTHALRCERRINPKMLKKVKDILGLSW